MTRGAITELQEKLELFCREGFIFDSNFLKEVKRIYSRDVSGSKKQFFELMVKQLYYVRESKNSVNMNDGNEILKRTGLDFTLYALHLKGKNLNVRLLITFLSSGTPLFLVAFNEKSGKR